MKKRKFSIALMTMLLFRFQASAHPGHGWNGGSYGLIHYLTEAEHAGTAAGLLLGCVGAAALFLWFRKR